MARPLLDINCQYEPYSEYPIVLRVPMTDGSIQKYVIQIQPGYQFQKVLDSLDRMTVGYPKKKNRRNR